MAINNPLLNVLNTNSTNPVDLLRDIKVPPQPKRFGDRFRNMTPEKKQNWANALYLLGGALKGNDMSKDMATLQRNQAIRKAEADQLGWNKTVDQMALERNPDGKLKYNASQIAILRTPAGRKAYTEFSIQRQFGGGKDRRILKGADDFQRYTDTGERVFPGISSTETNIDTWSITDSDGNRVTDLVNPKAKDLQTQVAAGNYINKTPVLSTAGKGAQEIGEIPGWNDDNGLLNRYKGYQGLVSSGQRIIDNLSTSPESVLLTGDIAQIFNQLGQEVTAMTGLIDRGKRDKFIKKAPEGVKNNFSKLAQETAITESQLLDFAYQIAKVRGQEGRGLSDQDFRNFQKIISAGRTAEEKAAALTNFINGVLVEIKSGLDQERNFRNQGLVRNPNNKEDNFVMNQIQDINKIGFRTIKNPFASGQTTSTNASGPKRIRVPLTP